MDELVQVMKLRRVIVLEVWLHTKVYTVSLNLVISENCWGLSRLPVFPIFTVDAGPAIPCGIKSLNSRSPDCWYLVIKPLVCWQSLMSIMPMASDLHTTPRLVHTGVFSIEEPKLARERVLFIELTTKQ